MTGIRTMVLGAALAFSVTSVAAAQGEGRGQARGGGRGNNPQAQMRGILRGITVTPEVTTKIEAVLTRLAADRREIMMAGRGDAAGRGGGGGGRDGGRRMMDEATMTRVAGLQTKAYAEIRALLTADQARAFDVNVVEMKKAQAARMRPPPRT